MRIVVLEEIPDDRELRESWNQLAWKMEIPEVFYTYEWAVAVQRAYRNSVSPLVLCAYEGDSLAGVVAFAGGKNAGREVAFLAANTSDYCDFLSEPGKRNDFVKCALAELNRRGIEKLVLANLPADSSSLAAVSDVSSGCHYHLHQRAAYQCARVLLGSGEKRMALKQSIGAKRRLRRNMRALEKLGPVSIQHDTDWNQIEPALESFQRAHVVRFLTTGKLSTLIGGERREFLHELARELCGSGWMSLSRLLVDGEPAAWNYGFQYAGSWFWYQPTVDSSAKYADLSPGFCLLAKIVELACDHPAMEVVDLGLGEEGYKGRFATASRETCYVVLNRSFSAHIRTAAREYAALVAKSSPRIENAIRYVISGLSRLKARLRASGFWGSLAWLGRRIRRLMFAFEEVRFYQWPRSGASKRSSDSNLQPLDSSLLGAAAIRYGDDPATLSFLMRSAQRFQLANHQAFALLNGQGIPVHFCWVKEFEGFEMAELERTLQAPSRDATMIFDCFTPPSERGHGFFADTIAAVADQLQSQGKGPWIFGAATNQASLRGIEKSGFEYRFSLGQERICFLKKAKDSIPSPIAENMAVASRRMSRSQIK